MLDLDLDLLVELGGWPVLKEARALVALGKVSAVTRAGARLTGRVQVGEKAYQASIVLAERLAQVEVRCTCPLSRQRVCAHILAVGVAALAPAPPPRSAPALPAPVTPGAKPASLPAPLWRALAPDSEETPELYLTLLLPWQLRESLAQPELRFILEAAPTLTEAARPWDAVAVPRAEPYRVSPADARALAALAESGGGLSAIRQVPRARLPHLLRELAGHPRLWLGKKQRLTVEATPTRPEAKWRLRTDGALEIELSTQAKATPLPAVSAAQTSLAGWTLDGTHLREVPLLPPGFSTRARQISRTQIPDFIAREWAALEAAVDLARDPASAELELVTARPEIEAHLEGTLTGLTLELHARYGGETFPIGSPFAEGYHPDPDALTRFWRRDPARESAAQREAEADGFAPARRESARLTLSSEQRVGHFLANRLPRWRERWNVSLGPRLTETLRGVDIAQPQFAWRGSSGEPWLSLDLQLTVRGQPLAVDPIEVQRWLQTGQSQVRQANRRPLLVPTEAWGEMREILADAAVAQTPGELRVARTSTPFVEQALRAEGFSSTAPLPQAPPPDLAERLAAPLLETLRPYQKEGVAWLAQRALQGQPGLLADDMGLGKTLQALAFAAWLQAGAPNREPMLIVCPTSLVANWLREAQRFVPHLRTLDLTGPERAARWEERQAADLLVTSYAILRRDAELWRGQPLLLALLDEAQHIKNRASQNAQSARALRARHRLLLTGTPLENSVLDLWSLFEFLAPGYLGSATDFRERYETPLGRSGADPKLMTRLQRRIAPFFLRRTRAQVLPELPPRLEHPTLCVLSDEQRAAYAAILAQGRRDVFEHASPAARGKQKIALLTTLLRLRQVCCHLALLPVDPAAPPREWREPSAKFDRTFELIEEAIDGGHRVLLFSQFVRVLHLLRTEAQRREIGFCYLDGQTSERQGEVDRFQNDKSIPLFLISLKAGGTGLNLTGADTVIHFDPWWNPAVEEQATARAHRLGQTRQVQAYKLIAAGTVEEKIQALQARKKSLFDASVGAGDEAFVEGLSGAEIAELLTDA